MANLTIDPAYIERLVVKIRAIMACEELDIPDLGGNASDDEIPATLQDLPDNLSREEIVEEIQGMSAHAQNELVALMWLGRDDYRPENWGALVSEAAEREEIPNEEYLLGHPLLAEYWIEGLQKLESAS